MRQSAMQWTVAKAGALLDDHRQPLSINASYGRLLQPQLELLFQAPSGILLFNLTQQFDDGLEPVPQ